MESNHFTEKSGIFKHAQKRYFEKSIYFTVFFVFQFLKERLK